MALAVEEVVLDFVSAYLNGEIKEEIHRNSRVVPELVHDKEASKSLKNKVFRLNKALWMDCNNLVDAGLRS